MSALVNQRCWNHSSREAVVRCPECRRFYCRECVVEHGGRMICAACFANFAPQPAPRARIRATLWSFFAVGGFFLVWLIFYYLGVILARVPSEFFRVT
jgi:hypothetical protein